MKAKIISIVILSILMISTGMAQQISYNAKSIKLIPESNYLPNADWEKLFYKQTETNAAAKVGLNKQVRFGPNERIYISDRSNFTISILDKSGQLIKTFGKKGYNNGEFANNQDLDGILNNKLLVVSDNQGRINFFDLDGNFVKLISIDFMPLRIFPLKSGNLIVWGHVPISGKKSKHVLAELNYSTGDYQVFHERTETNQRPDRIVIPTETSMIAIGSPYSKGNKFIRITNDDQVVIANSQSNTVNIFSRINGKYQESDFTIKTEPIKVGDKEKEEFYQNLKEKLEKKGLDASYAEKVKEDGFFPEHLPYFYNMILDQNSDALFFIYTKEGDHDFAFQAYSVDGKFLGESEFEIDGYDLLSKMGHTRFNQGYLYTMALKQGEEYPLRIIKCKLTQ